MKGGRRPRWNPEASSQEATWIEAAGEFRFARWSCSPGRRTFPELAGSPLDNGPSRQPGWLAGQSHDALQELTSKHCQRAQATPLYSGLLIGTPSDQSNGWGGLVFLSGSMVVKSVLALLAIVLTGFQTGSAQAQPSTLKVQHASAAGTSSGITEALVLETDQPTILEFSTTWCGPCKEMKPQIEELISKDYPVRVLDAEEHNELAHNFRVTRVPTFVFVDPDGKELARSEGLQDASVLASKFRVLKSQLAETRRKARESELANREIPHNEPRSGSRAERKFGTPGETIDAEHEEAHAKPWQTVVRIVVHGNGVMGFGSGTIISSNSQGSLILTCAHIFKIDGQREQYAPRQFPKQVTVDLFDGVLRGQELKTATRGIPAKVIDYDFQSDVGLISIAPGYALPASPVVPENWKPTPNMKMITAGCSGGRDATLWNTSVVKPESRMMLDRKPYEAIECLHEPIQGRSGGGLFTLDHYVAGVCDMAVLGGQRGLYATPRSIHAILGKNGFEALYKRQLQGFDQGQMLARNDPPVQPDREPVVRAQGPEELIIPPPSLLGVTQPNSSGMPPAGSLAMVDRMTENPVRTIPTTTDGWNGGSRPRKMEVAQPASTDGFTLPNASQSGRSSLAMNNDNDDDLVPISQEPEIREVASDQSQPGRVSRGESSRQSQTFVAENESDQKPLIRQAVNGAQGSHHIPKVRLLPVQDLDDPTVSGKKPWNSRPVRD